MTTSPGPGGFRSLAADLRGRTEAELSALLLARPDLARATIGDLASLAAAATTTASMTRALDALDRPALQVLEAALVLAPVDAETVAAAVGSTPEAVTPHLETLWSAALLWRSPEGLRPVRILTELLPTPAGLAPASTGAPGPGTEPWRQRLAELTGPERALLEALVWGPPVGEVTTQGPAALRGARDALVEAGVLTALSPTRVQLPREVALALREGRTHRVLETEPPAPAAEGAREASPASGRPSTLAGTTVTDATAAEVSGLLALTDELLLALETRPPAVLANGGLGVREVTALSRRLGIETGPTHLVLAVARAAGLVAAGPWPGAEGHRWGPTDAVDGWQQLDDAERAADLLQAWWGTAQDPDAAADGRRVNALAEAASSPTVRRARQELLTELAHLEGTPATPEELLARWQWSHPLRRPASHQVVTGLLEQARLLGLATIPPRDTGRWVAAPWLAPLASSGPGSAAGPTEGLADALRGALPPAIPSMLLQADLTAVVPGRPTPGLARLLHATTEVESRGGATTHRLSERSLRRALDAGYTAADLRAAIEAASATGLPQPVDYLLREVAAAHGRVQVADARSVLVVDDLALATRMLHDPDLSALALEQVAPTVITSHLPASQARAFLRDHGYGPALGGDLAGAAPRISPRSAPPVSSRLLTQAAAQERARALRAASVGEEEAEADSRRTRAPRMQSGDPVVVLAVLREAAVDGAPVWIWHTDDLGEVRTTLVTPTSVDGGRLYGVKDAERLPRAWSIHRIVGVAQGV